LQASFTARGSQCQRLVTHRKPAGFELFSPLDFGPRSPVAPERSLIDRFRRARPCRDSFAIGTGRTMKATICNDAFLVCHEIYLAARELVNSRIATTQFQSASKFLWRPDVQPRLVEYVADFARAGERALARQEAPCPCRTRGAERTAPYGCICGRRGKPPRASRLILFRVYYLGGAEYRTALHQLGLSERTWSDWAEEVRGRVGGQLIRAGMYPPSRYFRQASTNGKWKAKMKPVQHEPDFT
jgi:hypothetical protein